MLNADIINEQTRKTEQVIAQVTRMNVPCQDAEAVQREDQKEKIMPAPQQPSGSSAEHLANFIASLKTEIRKEVLNELIPLMEAMEKAAQGGAAPSAQANKQPKPPTMQDVQKQAVASVEQRTQDLQKMIEEKISQRRQRIFSRL